MANRPQRAIHLHHIHEVMQFWRKVMIFQVLFHPPYSAENIAQGKLFVSRQIAHLRWHSLFSDNRYWLWLHSFNHPVQLILERSNPVSNPQYYTQRETNCFGILPSISMAVLISFVPDTPLNKPTSCLCNCVSRCWYQTPAWWIINLGKLCCYNLDPDKSLGQPYFWLEVYFLPRINFSYAAICP